jgi:hypothetical protein
MADSIEGFLARAKCKNDMIQVVSDAPEGAYILVAVVPQGEPGDGRLAVYTPATTTFALYGFYALIELLIGGVKDDVFASMLGGEPDGDQI